ncbi:MULTISPECIES: DNA-J related domain-containing protein [Marinomonas]|uniref:DnaJ domain-containing protein n=1 Tax=Marinomonas arctica TaxID=383750 RepID=A0A7H1J5I9_9GAMM|nr:MULTISPECIES: DNA-J related domain-containing protein [Marinomonas]MCS7488106.1 molecular chaperone DnaJ [Marinomonas sp. BSi20414]QNT05755.1 DnaJ domain-containing protein [Marinomonas arctica]GGN36585.1 molecular chaperone [Marinomonas arctica]
MKNPLVGPILAILKTHPSGISEFDILKTLKDQLPEFRQLADDANLQLFRQHFLIMNALYQLQSSLWQEESLTLSINAMRIQLLSATQINLSQNTTLSDSVDAKLAAYYLDWSEYEKTDADEVSRLLNSFYKGISLPGNRDSALKTLQIDSTNPTKATIKQQYRKLAQKHHPDRGGDQDIFIGLRQAYEYLMF